MHFWTWQFFRPRVAALALSLVSLPGVVFLPLGAQDGGGALLQRPVLKLGSSRVLVTAGSVVVPVYAQHHGLADGLQICVSYDGSVLAYDGYILRTRAWQVERAVSYGSQRVFFFLSRVRGVSDWEGPAALMDPVSRVAHLLDIEFALLPPASGSGLGGEAGAREERAGEFFSVAAVGLGQEANPETSRGDSFFTTSRGSGAFTVVPTELYGGEVVVYYRDGVEAGSACATDAPQDFSIPLYVTLLAPAPRSFLVGVDYDELFFSVRGVRAVGPTIGESLENSLRLLSPGRLCFRVEFESEFDAPVRRLHVADVILHYNGAEDPGAVLTVVPALLEEAAGAGGEARAIGWTEPWVPHGGFVPGSIELLPPRFVRGNVDSSSRVRVDGKPWYGADGGDAIAILSAIFLGQEGVLCADAADVTDNGVVDLSDAVWLLNHLYRGGPPPAAPYPDFGTDPTLDALDCELPVPVYEPK